ncbi:MAG: nucleotidyl transferase AbiEii/AbiGii toxin family protein [Deltaproteobacteria bacterium]|nr:nucleotidyl transferase AbiEii/AbiGii toxin family protein [Deltaproteobacteria bacterium]
MKDHLLQVVAARPVTERPHAAREYVQLYLLRLLHEQGAMRRLAFLGGMALRILHSLPRFSENLDFCDVTAGGGRPDLPSVPPRLASGLLDAGYAASVKTRSARNVASWWFRLDALPRDVGWSSDPRLALKVKVEIDLAPPDGAVVETTLVQRFFPIALRHHDLPSLFAGKLHALLTRPYPKGRDWFDLVWYLTEKHGLAPNLDLLRNALAQTGHDPSDAHRWRKAARARLKSLDWNSVLRDVKPFLERQSDLEHLRQDLVDKLLRG